MASSYLLSFMFLLTHNMVLHCASAAVHSHSVDNLERESDGSYRPRDFDHYGDAGHNSEFDHEAILVVTYYFTIGSVKEAEEYDHLKPEESRRRLGLLLLKMDLNGDKFIDRNELKSWILNSFINLSNEEAQERMLEVDANRDGLATWPEYLRDAFGADGEEEISPDDTGETGMLLRDEKAMWTVADANGDGVLSMEEFKVFSNPEEHEVMFPFLVNQTMREKDSNRDGRIDFNEFVGDRGAHEDKSWLVSEKDKFDHELDADGDGALDASEVQAWVVPDNKEIAEEEVDHLFATADDDHDDLLSFEEILNHHDVFVGSEATDYGGDLYGDHFGDEL